MPQFLLKRYQKIQSHYVKAKCLDTIMTYSLRLIQAHTLIHPHIEGNLNKL
jgi:hypothetical protein